MRFSNTAMILVTTLPFVVHDEPAYNLRMRVTSKRLMEHSITAQISSGSPPPFLVLCINEETRLHH